MPDHQTTMAFTIDLIQHLYCDYIYNLRPYRESELVSNHTTVLFGSSTQQSRNNSFLPLGQQNFRLEQFFSESIGR